ncbi:MAG: hypothetical protein PUK26_04240 [Lachnoclostridium sp.]|nr:hypothetical protein [Lachnoclostridium sp.]
MNNKDLSIYAFLDKEFAIINHWLSFAEAKNAAVIALDTALIGISTRIIVSETVFQNNCLLIFIITVLALIIISLILALFSFLPIMVSGKNLILVVYNKFINVSGRASIREDKNYIFYRDIARLEKAENYLKMLMHNYGFPYFDKDQYLNDMAQEIYINSQVTVSKFIYFRLSASILIVALGLALIGLLLMLYTA